VKRASIVAMIACALGSAVFVARAANAPRPALEVWGAQPGDVVELDGAATTIKAGVTPRPFDGEPLPGNAAITHEVAAGRHAVIVRRDGCTARTFNVDAQGGYKRSIVLVPVQSAHCALPPPPPRAP
jgi:hypothetical protein